MKNSMSELFPGCEALMEDVEINNNVTVPTEDAEQMEEAGVVEGETQATEGAEIESEATETEAAATAFARQFGELCHMQSHIETYGVDRTFLALCNRDNILGRAFGIQMPACESFDTVGSPYSPLSIACVEAMGDSMWEKFKEWVKKIWQRIKNFFTRIADWFREMMGNYNLRLHKYKQWIQNHQQSRLLTTGGKVSDKEVLLPDSDPKDVDKKYREMCDAIRKDLFNNSEWQQCINEINTLIAHSVDVLQQYGNMSKADTQAGVASGLYNGNGQTAYEGSGITGYDPTKKENKATDKLLEKIDKMKKKVKDKDQWKFKKKKVSEFFKGADASAGGAVCIAAMTGLIAVLEETIKHNEEFERVRNNFSNTVEKNMDKLNSCVQRTNGGSLGAKSRASVNNQINHVTKVVFKSGIVPTINNKMIGYGFKTLNAFRECLESGQLDNE